MSNGWFKTVLLVICSIALLLVSASCKNRGKAVVEEGNAHDFTLNDIHGDRMTLSALRGKVVLLEFWATWCPPCRDSVSEMNELYDKFRGKDFELLAISLDEGPSALSTVTSFVKEKGITYPVLMDDGKVSSDYGVMNIPTVFIIDKSGKTAKKHVGLMPDMSTTLSKEIEAMF
jgi:peroxiredoxin